MTYNLSSIMRRAWEIVRGANVARFGLKLILRNALRTAWAEAKQAVALARSAPVTSGAVARIATEIRLIESKERLFSADWARLDRLNDELRQAVAA